MAIYGLKNIRRSYKGNTVLEAVDLAFEKGKIFALVGENGAGKTTLLETLALLEPPERGNLFFYDQEVDFKKDLTSLRQKIGFCMQLPFLFNTTVFNNVAYGLKIRGRKDFGRQIEKASSIFGISDLLSKKANKLSGGEAQKTALARTFVLDTPVVLLDEPTANLDEESIKMLEKVLSEIREKGNTVILATHQLDNAFRLANEVVTIKDKEAFPQSHQNFFSGTIKRTNGLKNFMINENVFFVVASDKQGKAKVSIDPKEIIISREKFKSSARNCLIGRITSIIDEGSIVKLTADCGVKLVSQITHRSLEELGINVGQEVYLTFKTSSVRVY